MMDAMDVSLVSQDARGCGNRKAGGIYACCGLSEEGLPIEHFIIDPVRPVRLEPFRTPMILEDGDVNHMLIWVGKEHYPSPLDFISEGMSMGFSRRISTAFPFEKLSAESRMIFVHPKAYLAGVIYEPDLCPKGGDVHEDGSPCFGAHHSHLAAITELEIEKTRTIGSTTYAVPEQRALPCEASVGPGIFLQLPLTHFEYQDDGRKAPPELKTIRERDITLISVPHEE